MADKSPRKAAGKKAGKTLKEKRRAKELKRKTGSSPFQMPDRRP